MSTWFGVLIALVLVIVVYEAFLTPLFMPVFGLLLFAFWIVLGNPVGQLTSGGGWMILLLMVWASRILAITLHAVLDAAAKL